jgi:hypothetical protein
MSHRNIPTPPILTAEEARKQLPRIVLAVLAQTARVSFLQSPTYVTDVVVVQGATAPLIGSPVILDRRQWDLAIVPVLSAEQYRPSNPLGGALQREGTLLDLLGRALEVSFTQAGWP